MEVIELKDLDIKKIADSGQAFRITEAGDAWKIIAQDRAVMVRQLTVDRLSIDCPKEELAFWLNYFDAGTDYPSVRAKADPSDSFLVSACELGKGIRILRQDPWEMLITFIISQRKNIPAISASVEKICAACGELKHADGFDFYAFPKPEALAKLTDGELRECSLGYRAPYIHATAEAVASGKPDLDAMKELPDEALLEELQKFSGVGPKVANCVSLFGYHRIAAFPIDVWIRRMIDEEYSGSFPLDKYAGCAGIIQQYIFYYARKRNDE